MAKYHHKNRRIANRTPQLIFNPATKPPCPFIDLFVDAAHHLRRQPRLSDASHPSAMLRGRLHAERAASSRQAQG
eukprot:1058329-Prymnesium_polylepis.2